MKRKHQNFKPRPFYILFRIIKSTKASTKIKQPNTVLAKCQPDKLHTSHTHRLIAAYRQLRIPLAYFSEASKSNFCKTTSFSLKINSKTFFLLLKKVSTKIRITYRTYRISSIILLQSLLRKDSIVRGLCNRSARIQGKMIRRSWKGWKFLLIWLRDWPIFRGTYLRIDLSKKHCQYKSVSISGKFTKWQKSCPMSSMITQCKTSYALPKEMTWSPCRFSAWRACFLTINMKADLKVRPNVSRTYQEPAAYRHHKKQRSTFFRWDKRSPICIKLCWKMMKNSRLKFM